MGGVFAHTYIGDNDQRQLLLFQGADRPLHDSVLGISLASHLVLDLGNAEQQNRFHSVAGRGLGFPQQGVDGMPVLTGHGIDRFRPVGVLLDKQGINEIGRTQDGFANHLAQQGIVSQTTRAMNRKHKTSKANQGT